MDAPSQRVHDLLVVVERNLSPHAHDLDGKPFEIVCQHGRAVERHPRLTDMENRRRHEVLTYPPVGDARCLSVSRKVKDIGNDVRQALVVEGAVKGHDRIRVSLRGYLDKRDIGTIRIEASGTEASGTVPRSIVKHRGLSPGASGTVPAQ